jgi:methylated-DNA-[protein]-cysteine S-methyltransferase
MPHTHLETPIGRLRLVANEEALTHVEFDGRWSLPPDRCGYQGANAVLDLACDQLLAYFEGTLHAFDLPLAPRGTPFQRQCWDALQTLGYGRVASYRDIATQIGNPIATRAVGAANGRNPIPIIIPCHRVSGANGSLTGFGGGIETKRFLLELEARHRPAHRDAAADATQTEFAL